jgi:hypothetical protein
MPLGVTAAPPHHCRYSGKPPPLPYAPATTISYPRSCVILLGASSSIPIGGLCKDATGVTIFDEPHTPALFHHHAKVIVVTPLFPPSATRAQPQRHPRRLSGKGKEGPCVSDLLSPTRRPHLSYTHLMQPGTTGRKCCVHPGSVHRELEIYFPYIEKFPENS